MKESLPVDEIVEIGKVGWYLIPYGKRCGKCLFLGRGVNYKDSHGYFCKIRPSRALTFDDKGPFRIDCIKKEVKR
jgi:hypothetical protein